MEVSVVRAAESEFLVALSTDGIYPVEIEVVFAVLYAVAEFCTSLVSEEPLVVEFVLELVVLGSDQFLPQRHEPSPWYSHHLLALGHLPRIFEQCAWSAHG